MAVNTSSLPSITGCRTSPLSVAVEAVNGRPLRFEEHIFQQRNRAVSNKQT